MNKKKAAHARRHKRYGLTPTKFYRMLKKQNGKCGVCKKSKAVVVDHCHRSARVRELLCQMCNLGLGQFKENPKLLKAAAKYIERWK